MNISLTKGWLVLASGIQQAHQKSSWECSHTGVFASCFGIFISSGKVAGTAFLVLLEVSKTKKQEVTFYRALQQLFKAERTAWREAPQSRAVEFIRVDSS